MTVRMPGSLSPAEQATDPTAGQPPPPLTDHARIRALEDWRDNGTPISAQAYGVVGDGVTNNSAALAAWLADVEGREGYLPPGTYLYDVGLSGAGLSTTIRTSGKGSAILRYTGTGVALTWGTLISTGNMNLILDGVYIFGTAAGEGGLHLRTFQDFTLLNCDVRGFTAGFGIFEDNVNTGLAVNTNVRQNAVGWRIGFNANLNTHIGGQITENTIGIHTDSTDSWDCEWIGANLAVNTRAVYFQWGQLHKLSRCWFESNAAGQPASASILIGDLDDVGTADFIRVRDCYFSETNLVTGVRVYRSTESQITGNEHSSVGATAFVHTDPGAIDTIVRDNVRGLAPLLTDFGVRTRAEGPGFAVPTIASAATITIPPGCDVASITGSTTITSVTGSFIGRRITLLFTGTLTVSDGAGATTLQLAGNFAATPDDALTLVWDGTFWRELARSAN